MMNGDPIKKNNVKIIGKTDADTAMIFAHGFGTDQTSWQVVAEEFSNQYKIILYDNAGGGNSDPEAFSPNKYNSLDSYADDLIAICEVLHIQDAIMVAHSVSGMISLLASTRKSQYFSKMILVGASPRYRNDDNYIGGFEQSDLDSLYEAMDNNYFAWVSGFSQLTMANPENPKLAESFAATLSSIRPDIAQSVARVIFQSDYRNYLSKVNKETLIIQSKNDIAVPLDVAQYLNKHISNSKLVVVNATGHFPHISAPHEIISAIKGFINE